MKEEKYGIGRVFKNNRGEEFEIIERLDSAKVILMFLDEYKYKKVTTITNIRRGSVNNPFFRSYKGIGYLGDGNHIRSINRVKTKSYKYWQRMLDRCYSDVYSYCKNTTVCNEWHNFTTFANWFEKHYPYQIDGVKFDLDKDLLQNGVENKVYSPDTCVFLPEVINSYITNKSKGVSGITGVYVRGNKWISAITIDGKYIHLGSFDTKEEAEEIYLNNKNQRSLYLQQYLRSLNYLPEEIIQLVRTVTAD
jgi:hypothetical protein